MGGATSEVSDATTDVAIESAIFDPVSIRRTAQRLALRSEASSRFEKGQEPRLARIGADRTAQLVRGVGGRRGRPRARRHRARRARAVAGHVPARADQPAAGHRAVGRRAAGRCCRGSGSRPSRRRGEPVDGRAAARAADRRCAAAPGEAPPRSPRSSPPGAATSSIEADVAEEIARVRGYELTPSVTPDTAHAGVPPVAARGARARPRDARGRRPDRGRDDRARVARATSRSFALASRTSPSVGDEPQPGGAPIAVTNPLSRDHSVLRTNLLGSLLDVVGTNLRHGTEDVAVFEIGKGYARAGDEPREWWRLGVRARRRRRSRRPGTAPRGRTTWTTRRACSSCSPHRLDLGASGLRGRSRARPCSTPDARLAPRSRAACMPSSASCTRRRVDAWELRTGDAGDRGRGRDRGPRGGAADARAGAGRRPSPGGRTRPRDRRRRGDARGRRSRRSIRAPRRRAAAGRRACSTSTAASPLAGTREEPRVPPPAGAPTGRSPRPRSRPPSRRSWTALPEVGGRLRA